MGIVLDTADRDTWLAARRKGVGASEAAIVRNESPFGTPLGLYYNKRGEVPDFEPEPWMVWGLRIEPSIAAGYAEELGVEIQKAPALMQHDRWRWMLASLDYVRDDRVIECKRVVKYKADDFGPSGSDEIPPHYYCQLQQQMAVSGKRLGDLAALIGDCDFRIFTVEYNRQFVEALAEEERQFMVRVNTGEPPLPDFSHQTTYDLLRTLDTDPGAHIALDIEHQEAADQLLTLQASKRETEKAIEAVKSRLMHAMGRAEFGYLPDGRSVKRKGERFWITKPKVRH